MRFAGRASIAATATAVTVVVLAAAGAWACVPGGGSGKKLSVTPAQVQPGDQVTVAATSSARASLLEVRLDGTDGPLLGTLSSDRVGTADGGSSATFTVPLTTPPGRHALIAVQAGVKWDPAVLAVADPDGTVPESPAPAALGGSRTSQGRGPLAIVLAVASLGLGAALWSVRASRQRTRPVSPVAREV